MLNEWGITTCKIIDTHNEPGLSSGLQAKIYYYVNDTQYISYDLLPSRKHKVGEKYKLKYSWEKNPRRIVPNEYIHREQNAINTFFLILFGSYK